MIKGFWNTLPKPFFVLAPMADVTDAAFRRIIAKYSKYGGANIFDENGRFIPHLHASGGPDVTWTEFVSADGLFRGEHPTDPSKGAGYDVLIKDLMYTEAERPIVAQFFSKEPELMKRAGQLAVELGFDGVDINMGCPDKNVCKQGSGAAMIQTPELAQEIIQATQEGVEGKIPVSVKTRIGYNTNEIETWVPALLETNPAVLTLHARTKKEMSKVPADWSQIKRAVAIRDEVQKERSDEEKTLLVGNGDVMSIEEGRERVKETGCDGVMLGRAIFGNPWLFSGNERPDLKDRLEVLLEHTELFDELLGDTKSFFLMKKHFKSYIKGDDTASDHSGAPKRLILELMDAEDKKEIKEIIQDTLHI